MLHKAPGEHMLQEAVDELFGFQRAAAFLAGIGIPVAKGHAVILQLQDAVIANGHRKM